MPSERIIEKNRSHPINIWWSWLIWVIIIFLHLLQPCHKWGWRLIVIIPISAYEVGDKMAPLLNCARMVLSLLSCLDHREPRVLAFTAWVVREAEWRRVDRVVLTCLTFGIICFLNRLRCLRQWLALNFVLRIFEWWYLFLVFERFLRGGIWLNLICKLIVDLD